METSRRFAALAAVLLLLAGGVAMWALAGERSRPPLGLFTSLPIYWAETSSIAEAIDGKASPHWARTALDRDYRVKPLDTLEAAELSGIERLVLAQPRPLAPAENVALDDWVRGGGRLLLFADPFLTERSRFPIGDKRRPQDVVLVSPILAHWGLELRFDEEQGEGERTARIGGRTVPVHLAGHLAADAGGSCSIADGGLTADCAVGKGRVLVVADAALLEGDRTDGTAVLGALTARAFGG